VSCDEIERIASLIASRHPWKGGVGERLMSSLRFVLHTIHAHTRGKLRDPVRCVSVQADRHSSDYRLVFQGAGARVFCPWIRVNQYKTVEPDAVVLGSGQHLLDQALIARQGWRNWPYIEEVGRSSLEAGVQNPSQDILAQVPAMDGAE
jgi:hypothetical protein